MTRHSCYQSVRRLSVSALCIAVLLLSSCTSRIGYGVVQWSVPEYGLAAGDVVPVFIKSNIGKVYVVGSGPGYKTRLELPLWQLSLYKNRGAAVKAAEAYGEYHYTYAQVKIDGLPIRSDPENTAKMVYRLKLGEKIKILEKGEGSPVMSGKTALQGDWLRVLTDNGTTGWSFSYNLTVYDERDENALSGNTEDTGPDPVLENILARTWYPESYRTMIEKNRVDLSLIDVSWGFFPGADSNIARIVSADGTVSFQYTSVVRHSAGEYRFEGSSLVVQTRGRGAILVSYTDANGMPQAKFFVPLDVTPEEIIAAETERRELLLATLSEAGPVWRSGNYGVLQFIEGGKFLWSGWQILSPSIIPAAAGSGGDVQIRYFPRTDLTESFDGVLSFRFESSSTWIHFLYSLRADGLRLEHVSQSNIKDSVVQTRNLNPVILFFTSSGARGDL